MSNLYPRPSSFSMSSLFPMSWSPWMLSYFSVSLFSFLQLLVSHTPIIVASGSTPCLMMDFCQTNKMVQAFHRFLLISWKRRFIFVTKTFQKECLCHKPKSCKVYHAYSWSSLCLLLINQSSNTLYTYKLYVLHMNLSSDRKIKEPTRFARTKRTFLYNWWSYICQYLQPYFPEHCYLKVNTSML